jgi:Spy/CpxP family protein refolding chaperone
MFHGFFLGVLGGVAAAKIFSRRGGGCGRSGAGCGGPSGRGFGGGLGGPWGLWSLVRELELSPAQWQQGRAILHDLKVSMKRGRHDLRSSLGPALAILSEPEWQSARAEQLAQGHDESFAKVRSSALQSLEQLHRLLTPEQRDRLRRFIAVPPPPQ